MIKVFTDGGSRGNPGAAAAGVYITDSKGKKIHAFRKYIGIETNNVAEYSAVIEALKWLNEHPDIAKDQETISFFLDSLLVVSQIKGEYKVKNPRMKELLFEVRIQESRISLPISYQHIPREQNKKADEQVNMALDNLTR